MTAKPAPCPWCKDRLDRAKVVELLKTKLAWFLGRKNSMGRETAYSAAIADAIRAVEEMKP